MPVQVPRPGAGVGTASATLPDGAYTLAFRPHHVSLSQSGRHTVPVSAKVGTSEITGSETYIHVTVDMGGVNVHWVVLTHGVHRVNNGDAITVFLDPARYYLFAGSDGSLSRAPVNSAKAA